MSGGEGDDRDIAARLDNLAAMESWKARVQESVRADPARIAAGWERRFLADRARTEEAVALYREMGYEVATDPVKPEDLDPGCADCALIAAMGFQMVYTRRRGGGQEPGRAD